MMARILRILAGGTVAASLAFPQAPSSRPSPGAANALSPPPDQNAGEVIGPDNLIYSVADLDRSVAFYRDTLGLELTSQVGRAAGLPAPAPLNEALSDLTGTHGAKFRAATFELPGAGFGLELTEFTGIEKKAGEARTYDPGAAMLVLTVRDVDAVLSSVRKAGGRIVTAGGEPVNLAGRNGGGRRFVFVRDPDGVLIELSQPYPLPSTTAALGSQVIGGRFGLTVEDTEKTLNFYHRVFGFESKPGAAFAANSVVQNGVGATGAQFRNSSATLPGGAVTWELVESRNIDRKPFRLRVPDPGAPAFSLGVRDADAPAARVQAEGGSVVSRSGGLDKKPGIFVRDPNGFLIELIQRPVY